MKCPAVQAAEAEVVKMKELIRVRGCNEEFIADPALLQEGKVQLCPALPLNGLPAPASSHPLQGKDSFNVSVEKRCNLLQVDFLPAAAMSAEDLERQRQVAAELAKRTRWVDFVCDGQPSQVQLVSVSAPTIPECSIPLLWTSQLGSIHIFPNLPRLPLC